MGATIKKWSVWLADLNPVIGSEQGNVRPVIIMSATDINGLINVVNVIPVTSRKTRQKIYPNEVLLHDSTYGLEVVSIALAYQIRTLDRTRLIRILGSIDDFDTQNLITEALVFQLDLQV